MLIVFEWIRTAAKSDISVLILGPTGSGKEVVARMIHELSRRALGRFQAVNCAALPDTLFESEIFGYEKGAFTGAHDRKPGRLELANDGTLFLDEIGDLSLVAQAKLLRVLEERRFERLGGNRADRGRLPADLGDQPAARPVRARRPVPRGSRTTASTRSRSGCRRCASGRSTSRCSPSGSSPATAPPTACRSTPRRSRARRSTCWATTPGPATSASSRAPCRAPRCRRPGGSSAPADIEFLHASERARRGGPRPPAVAARGRARPHRPGARGGAVEQEGGRRGARNQPRHAVPEDSRVRPRAAVQDQGVPKADVRRRGPSLNPHRINKLGPDLGRPHVCCYCTQCERPLTT